MLFITGAQTCPRSHHRLEASAWECAWVYANMLMSTKYEHMCRRRHITTEYVSRHWFGDIFLPAHKHTQTHTINEALLIHTSTVWKMAFYSILTLISPPPLRNSFYTESSCHHLETWTACKGDLLYQSHNTPTLNSAQPIYTQPIRLVCSHWKCL